MRPETLRQDCNAQPRARAVSEFSGDLYQSDEVTDVNATARGGAALGLLQDVEPDTLLAYGTLHEEVRKRRTRSRELIEGPAQRPARTLLLAGRIAFLRSEPLKRNDTAEIAPDPREHAAGADRVQEHPRRPRR